MFPQFSRSLFKVSFLSGIFNVVMRIDEEDGKIKINPQFCLQCSCQIVRVSVKIIIRIYSRTVQNDCHLFSLTLRFFLRSLAELSKDQ